MTAVRRTSLRTAFFADFVFAIACITLSFEGCPPGRNYRPYRHFTGGRGVLRLCILPPPGAVNIRSGCRYSFLKLGVRLSMNACMPSFWSAVANMEWNSRRSNRMPSFSVVS